MCPVDVLIRYGPWTLSQTRLLSKSFKRHFCCGYAKEELIGSVVKGEKLYFVEIEFHVAKLRSTHGEFTHEISERSM